MSVTKGVDCSGSLFQSNIYNSFCFGFSCCPYKVSGCLYAFSEVSGSVWAGLSNDNVLNFVMQEACHHL